MSTNELKAKDRENLVRLLLAAEAVKLKLVQMLGLGQDSIEAYAYAVKARTKAFDSAIRKITKKRKEKRLDKPYGPENLTDIIGIRILCLWPDEIFGVVQRLLTAIEQTSATVLSNFRNVYLHEIVEEIIIYRAKNSPAAYGLIKAQLLDFLRGKPSLTMKVREVESPPEKPYSSVHIVLWCRVEVAGEWKSVPVEVQVRTSLEDVWAEADHKLKYKSSTGVSKIPDHQRKIGEMLLRNLKDQLDMVATTLVGIRDLLSEERISATTQITGLDGHPVEYWGLTSRSASIKKKAAGMAERLKEVYAKFEGKSDEDKTASGDELQSLLDELLAFTAEVEKDQVAGDTQDTRQWRFTSGIEKANILYWQARIAKDALGDARGMMLGEGQAATEAVERCLNAYIALAAQSDLEDRPMLWFRLGNALIDLKGDFPAAAPFVHEAVRHLNSESGLPGDSEFRVIIPRVYSYCLWRKQYDVYAENIARYGVKSAAATECLPGLAEALTLMLPLPDQVERAREGEGIWDKARERRRVLNNVISYAWEYSIRSCESEGVDRLPSWPSALNGVGLSRDHFLALYDQFKSRLAVEAPEPSIGYLHTLAVGAYMAQNEVDFDAAIAKLTVAVENPQAGVAESAMYATIKLDLSWLKEFRKKG